MKGLIATLVSRLPAVDCCPHEESDDPDTAHLPAGPIHHDYRGSVSNG